MRSRAHPILSRFKNSWKQQSLHKTGNILEMVSMFVAPELGILLTVTAGIMNVVSTHNRQRSGIEQVNQAFADQSMDPFQAQETLDPRPTMDGPAANESCKV